MTDLVERRRHVRQMSRTPTLLSATGVAGGQVTLMQFTAWDTGGDKGLAMVSH